MKRSLECHNLFFLLGVSLMLVSLRKWRRRSGIREGGPQRHDTTLAGEHEHHEDEERIHAKELTRESALVFKFYGEEDEEPVEPPMPLCDSVRATLASYNVDPVRGEKKLRIVNPVRGRRTTALNKSICLCRRLGQSPCREDKASQRSSDNMIDTNRDSVPVNQGMAV